jgi:mandelate racemase
MADGLPLITRLETRGVIVPLSRPLATGGGKLDKVPLILIDITTDQEITGRTYLFIYLAELLEPTTSLIATLGESLLHQAAAPQTIYEELMARFTLAGHKGVAATAIAAIDMALWDIAAKARDLPLASLLGATAKSVKVYNSCGLGLMGARDAGKQAVELLDGGFEAVKLRLGYDDPAEDLEAARAVRKAVGLEIEIMSDYNQCLSADDAVKRIETLEQARLCWVEEPVAFDDYAGCATVRAASALPIQIGENCWGERDIEAAISAGASDYLMPDVMKCSGVTGWLKAAAVAEAHDIPVSSHLYPEVSVHLLAATGNCHYLEYVDWANPVLARPLRIANGEIEIRDEPGIGIDWDDAAIEIYAA